MKRLLWKAWHLAVNVTSTALAIVAALFILICLALMEYEARTDWDA